MHGIVDGRLQYRGQWLDASRRNAIPLRVRNAFRIREANTSIYYLEIYRDYRSASSPGVSCPGYSYLPTWVLSNADAEFISIEQEFRLIDCDGKTDWSDTPLVFWKQAIGIDLLVRRLGFESEEYLILTIEDGAITERTEMSFRR